jgi:hypothetical protein
VQPSTDRRPLIKHIRQTKIDAEEEIFSLATHISISTKAQEAAFEISNPLHPSIHSLSE